MPRNVVYLAATVACCLAVLGCSFAPAHVRPEMPLPAVWEGEPADTLEARWWRRCQDEQLNTLVEEAVRNNRDIEQAFARVDSARARLGLARAELFPAPAVQGGAGRSRVSRLTTPSAIGRETVSNDSVNAGVSSWEIDLWGRHRDLKDAAAARLLAAEATRDGVWLAVAGQTTKGYFLLRAFDMQETVATETLKTREKALTIYTARYEQGVINELDLLRAKTEVEAARSALYRTRIGRDAAESALAALAGRPPREIMREGIVDRGRVLDTLPTAPAFPAGLPSDLLERRPDIRAAEEALRAANFNIGAARAEFFPSISLTGLLGFASTELDTLLSGNARTWQLGGGVYLPLDFWRIQADVLGAEAYKRETAAFYEQTVQNAFRELRDALSQQARSAEVVRSLELMVDDLRKAVELARARYDNGYSAYLEVLDAERSLFNAEMDLAEARNNLLSGIVNVCLAMGGGWTER
jgi:multidrug efflux system outer membrane protein